MALRKLSDVGAVRTAMMEYDALGREGFLAKYGYGEATEYLVVDPLSGRAYDSKAIAGVAYGLEFPQEGPLKSAEFSGGAATVTPVLERLGFTIVAPRADWTEAEVEATVERYFTMLAEEAAGLKVDKRAHRDVLRPSLLGRSDSAIERKHSNISAVLEEAEYPWVSAFKPLHNYQRLLAEVTLTRAKASPEVFALLLSRLETATLIPPTPIDPSLAFVPPPPRQHATTPSRRAPRKYDHAARDAAARALGRRGEEWVLMLERERLKWLGLADLAQRVHWVSDEDGDGAGYDIASFDEAGAEIFIEVKTTNGPAETAFLVSRNEVACSKELGDAFKLYRVFAFASEAPRVFVLSGDLEASCSLTPDTYRAKPAHE